MSNFIPFPGANPADLQKAKEIMQKDSPNQMHDIVTASIISLLHNERSMGESLLEKLSELLDNYCDKLDCIASLLMKDLGSSLSANANKIRHLILGSLQLYQNGQHCAAYHKFIEIFEADPCLFDTFVSEIEPTTSRFFYRLRCGKASEVRSQRDMFHIPFEMKNLACQCRYSEHGHPSLYLASSLYTAWKETAKGQLEEVYFSRYENRKKIKIINLVVYPELLLNEKNVDRRRSLLSFMPLLIACSMKAPSADSKSKDEYIVPQLLMKYVRLNKKDIVGIQYTSTHWINEDQAPFFAERLGACLVFPARSVLASGYCSKLANFFALTEPMLLPFTEIDSLSQSDVKLEELNRTPAIMYNGILHKYSDFAFGKAEIASTKNQAKFLK